MYNKDLLIKEYSNYAHHLGNYYPYFLENDSSQKLFINICDALNVVKKKVLDLVGIVEIVSNSYLLGNRTLVNNVKRLPWMTCFDSVNSPYNLSYKLPIHDYRVLKKEVLANMFKNALKEELNDYVIDKQVVGILLSGGYDSRILAGLLKELQIEGKYTGDVISITWGLEKSRDVIYAKEISRRFSWQLEHLKLNAELLFENIYLAGKMGAEFSPFHLHAMKKVKDIGGIEIVIAGSYGDSVGRAEFSGKKIMKLKSIIPKNKNSFGLLRESVVKSSLNKLYLDAYGYKDFIKRSEEYQYFEIEQELHYMRRKLQACMNIIGENVPLYQLYTNPKSFGLMWSIDPKQRTDTIYKLIIASLPFNVDMIPWARNGKTIYGTNNTLFTGNKLNHNYGKWLRNDLYNEIKKMVLSDNIRDLNIFNERCLKYLVEIWHRQTTTTVSKLDELVSWIASLSVFVSEYNVVSPLNNDLTYIDYINSVKGPLTAKVYSHMRKILRN